VRKGSDARREFDSGYAASLERLRRAGGAD